jgi:hypothetical protein
VRGVVDERETMTIGKLTQEMPVAGLASYVHTHHRAGPWT